MNLAALAGGLVAYWLVGKVKITVMDRTDGTIDTVSGERLQAQAQILAALLVTGAISHAT
jgi:hypothetical protein